MGLRSQRTGKRLSTFLVVCGAGVIAGWLASLSADPARTAAPSSSELSPAQIVAMRFQPDAHPVAASSAPAGYVLASVVDETAPASRQLFSPYPIYASLSGATLPGRAVDDDSSSSSSSSSTEQALAYAPAAPPAHATGAGAAPAIKRAISPPHPASASNAVLNDAQIASIRDRLRLTSYQQQLWPPVESALRDIAYRQARNDASRNSTYRSGAQSPLIDTNSTEVQRLKSAAIPLIMSMNEDQKQEVRAMARLMGLEQLASAF